MDIVKQNNLSNATVPMLIPYEPGEFWAHLQLLIREEVGKIIVDKKNGKAVSLETPGLTSKPLYKMSEVCAIFQITRPTIYEWIKAGKLKPLKIRSHVYFLGADIEGLLTPLV